MRTRPTSLPTGLLGPQAHPLSITHASPASPFLSLPCLGLCVKWLSLRCPWSWLSCCDMGAGGTEVTSAALPKAQGLPFQGFPCPAPSDSAKTRVFYWQVPGRACGSQVGNRSEVIGQVQCPHPRQGCRQWQCPLTSSSTPGEPGHGLGVFLLAAVANHRNLIGISSRRLSAHLSGQPRTVRASGKPRFRC